MSVNHPRQKADQTTHPMLCSGFRISLCLFQLLKKKKYIFILENLEAQEKTIKNFKSPRNAVHPWLFFPDFFHANACLKYLTQN